MKSMRSQTFLWIVQRASAAVLALCVLVHLATIIYAVRGGLTGAEILARTRGSAAWFAFYSLFVLAVTVHAPIGLRAVLGEWLGWLPLGGAYDPAVYGSLTTLGRDVARAEASRLSGLVREALAKKVLRKADL